MELGTHIQEYGIRSIRSPIYCNHGAIIGCTTRDGKRHVVEDHCPQCVCDRAFSSGEPESNRTKEAREFYRGKYKRGRLTG